MKDKFFVTENNPVVVSTVYPDAPRGFMRTLYGKDCAPVELLEPAEIRLSCCCSCCGAQFLFVRQRVNGKDQNQPPSTCPECWIKLDWQDAMAFSNSIQEYRLEQNAKEILERLMKSEKPDENEKKEGNPVSQSEKKSCLMQNEMREVKSKDENPDFSILFYEHALREKLLNGEGWKLYEKNFISPPHSCRLSLLKTLAKASNIEYDVITAKVKHLVLYAFLVKGDGPVGLCNLWEKVIRRIQNEYPNEILTVWLVRKIMKECTPFC